ncbi:MAG: glycoside hydrolase family 2 TIM barrel-domain containing protein [Lentisphaeria bacterium]
MRSVQSLNGVWDFAFFQECGMAAIELSALSFTSVLTVPGCYDVLFPYAAQRGTGVYRRRVYCSGLVKLNIAALGLAAEVYWDQQLIKSCPYAYMPESMVFDSGSTAWHELIILVNNQYNQVFFPFYDFYGYGGIYGDVDLESLPEFYLDDIRISTLDYRQGLIRLQVRASATPAPGCHLQLRFDASELQTLPFDSQVNIYELKVPQFQLWSPATPCLHHLQVSCGADELALDFGIRQIAVAGNQLLLNGVPLRLMGYNRHESHPQFGAAMPPSLIEADLLMIREQGCNFIRGSHYPQNRHFLELCDRLGILVWEETLGWDVKFPTLGEAAFLEQQLDQARRLVRNSYNHPSIIIWGFLNETESQLPELRPIIKKLCDAFHAEDDTRLVTYASNKYEKDCCCDLVDIIAMNPYPGWGDANWEKVQDIDQVKPRLDRLLAALPSDKPVLISEIGAGAIYGFRDPFKARWSEEYQALLLKEICNQVLGDERFCGLCIWQFCNAKSYINGYVMGRSRGFNNKGILDEYRRPKLAWDIITSCIQQARAAGKPDECPGTETSV